MSPAPDTTPPADGTPQHCDVLVVGAGPAGSACARQLALAGWQVILVDKRSFPRDKVCGDGLIPDSMAALRRLGVLDRVLAQARPVGLARCVAPSRQSVDIPGDMAVVPRRLLDQILCQAAVEAGALFLAPAEFIAPRLDADGRVCGARFKAQAQTREIGCRWLVLATGAAVGPLEAAQLCERKRPSGFALRQYIRHEELAQQMDSLRFIWHRALRGGYGWIFPGPDGVCNIGVGVLNDRSGRGSRRLPRMFARLGEIDPVAARLLAEGVAQGPLQGAPLRCDLEGARWYRPGLLLTGEAAGSTYSFTGEGIGKALESGLAAADSLLESAADDTGAAHAPPDEAVQLAYGARLQALHPRFAMYRKAASFNRHPWLVNLVIWRIRASARAIAVLADILAERRLPYNLLSWRGLRALWRIR
ncbi:MAG: NAD(P)/FAD-dependent oxidoreductase [Hylemonella sp.]|nr:NAD(P)/FAD-dependent oxidoreductase [Hylemonella sp.]